MIETKGQHHHRLLFALAAAAGLGLGLALIAFCDAWYSGSGFSGMQVIDAALIECNFALDGNFAHKQARTERWENDQPTGAR